MRRLPAVFSTRKSETRGPVPGWRTTGGSRRKHARQLVFLSTDKTRQSRPRSLGNPRSPLAAVSPNGSERRRRRCTLTSLSFNARVPPRLRSLLPSLPLRPTSLSLSPFPPPSTARVLIDRHRAYPAPSLPFSRPANLPHTRSTDTALLDTQFSLSISPSANHARDSTFRTYYEKLILVPVPKTGLYPKKLVYKFGPNAHGWNTMGGSAKALSGVKDEPDDDDDEDDDGNNSPMPETPPALQQC